MAWLRAMGSATEPGKRVLYKDGTQSVSFESPGSYTAPGDTFIPSTFEADHIRMQSTGSAVTVVGTVTSIDITDYSVLHVVSRRNSGSSTGCFMVIGSSKNIPGFDTRANVVNSGTVYNEYTLDISGYTGNKYIYLTTSAFNMDVDVKEIWLSET